MFVVHRLWLSALYLESPAQQSCVWLMTIAQPYSLKRTISSTGDVCVAHSSCHRDAFWRSRQTSSDRRYAPGHAIFKTLIYVDDLLSHELAKTFLKVISKPLVPLPLAPTLICLCSVSNYHTNHALTSNWMLGHTIYPPTTRQQRYAIAM